MALYFRSFASGSSGNSYLIRSETTAIIVDAGISGKRIMEGLEQTSTEPDEVKALLVTHEHIDHVRSLKVLHKKLPELTSYSNLATWEHIKDKVPEESHVTIESGETFKVGDIEVRSFSTHHDSSDSICYSLIHEGKQVTILTDTGHICDDLYNEVKGADILALEANHDPNVLHMCRYPYYVKRRILGDYGHLSNEAAAECIARMHGEDPKRRRVLLAHLSKENNSPEMAMITVENYLQEKGVFPGDELVLDVLMRDEISDLYKV